MERQAEQDCQEMCQNGLHSKRQRLAMTPMDVQDSTLDLCPSVKSKMVSKPQESSEASKLRLDTQISNQQH